MSKITNYHVPDQTNVGDFVSSPLHYFDFPGFDCQIRDIRDVNDSNVDDSHLLVGGGGLLFHRFRQQIETLNFRKKGKLFFWGVGQQQYGLGTYHPEEFDYEPYFPKADLIGIRDYNTKYSWLPCVSCMNSAFDKPRSAKHEFVVLSHKKFHISIPGIPRMTNETNDLEKVLDFLGSGETILTTSFHAAYWGTLLNRRVLVFPFTSKFLTMKHQPVVYPAKKWSQERWKLTIRKKVILKLKNPGDLHTCDTKNWKNFVEKTKLYPESLEECRAQNRSFYNNVMDILNC